MSDQHDRDIDGTTQIRESPTQASLANETTIERCLETGTYRARHDWSTGRPISVTVAEVITEATKERRDETEPVYESIDLGAVDDLFRPADGGKPRTAGRVTFEHRGFKIEIETSGEIQVRPSRGRRSVAFG